MKTYTVPDLVVFLKTHNRNKAALAIANNIKNGRFSEGSIAEDLPGLINNLGSWGNTKEGSSYWSDLSSHVRSLVVFLTKEQTINPYEQNTSYYKVYTDTSSVRALEDVYKKIKRSPKGTPGSFIIDGFFK